MGTTGIVILNYNTLEDTVRCVNSIFANTASMEGRRVYIVDNASPDGSGKLLSSRYHGSLQIRVLLSDRNGGFSYGNNLGIREALADGCQVIFLLNSDVYLENDAITQMELMMEQHPAIATVGPRVLDREGRDIQFARKALTFRAHLLERLPFLGDRQVRRYRYHVDEDYIFSGMVSGCCFGLRSDFVKKNQVMDDQVFLYYEEDILAHQLVRDGKKAGICSGARVVHNEAVSTKKSVQKGRGSFERMYRWSSAVYVLKQYAGATKRQLRFIAWLNRFEWKLLSLVRKEYDERLPQFVELLDEMTGNPHDKNQSDHTNI